ncbi:hypothetical protein PoB_007272100 [Plakobranchus ocellatus]|uniref:Uncharacterized protein n=1 Tax=Plakobranchus ocellatus TaxID=259542 RepID=A0AAV4DQS8_9GAST|nr:hypothetical protein PoB_007272100 [Plakobranchus ocellatus]
MSWRDTNDIQKKSDISIVYKNLLQSPMNVASAADCALAKLSFIWLGRNSGRESRIPIIPTPQSVESYTEAKRHLQKTKQLQLERIGLALKLNDTT